MREWSVTSNDTARKKKSRWKCANTIIINLTCSECCGIFNSIIAWTQRCTTEQKRSMHTNSLWTGLFLIYHGFGIITQDIGTVYLGSASYNSIVWFFSYDNLIVAIYRMCSEATGTRDQRFQWLGGNKATVFHKYIHKKTIAITVTLNICLQSQLISIVWNM